MEGVADGEICTPKDGRGLRLAVGVTGVPGPVLVDGDDATDNGLRGEPEAAFEECDEDAVQGARRTRARGRFLPQPCGLVEY